MLTSRESRDYVRKDGVFVQLLKEKSCIESKRCQPLKLKQTRKAKTFGGMMKSNRLKQNRIHIIENFQY